MAPASKREISSRSSTSPWNRLTSLDSRSSAAWARSGISSRRASITSTDADRVINGERSSWLTSEAKRASRSIRACSADGHVVERVGEHARGRGRRSVSRRVSRRPPAIALAACAASATRPHGAPRREHAERARRAAVVITTRQDRATGATVRTASVVVAEVEELEVGADRSAAGCRRPSPCSLPTLADHPGAGRRRDHRGRRAPAGSVLVPNRLRLAVHVSR